jgi:hypothetical protein
LPAIRRTRLNLITLFLIYGILIWGETFIPKPCLGQELRATPYRPTLSNPAQLPVPGYVEMEMGWQSLKEKATDDYLHSVPYLFKLAFSEYIGLLVGGEALIVKDFDQGSTLAGIGDLTPLLKFKVPSSSQTASAFGLEVGARLPTAPETISRQQTDYLITGIYSTEIGHIGIDLNVGYTRLGGTASGRGKNNLFWAVAPAYGLTKRWSVAGELAGTVRRDVKPFMQFLTSTSYFFLPRLVGDTGIAFGLNGASQEWTLFAGMTILLGKVY